MSGIFNAITDFFTLVGSIIGFVFKALQMLFVLLVSGVRFLVSLLGILPTPFMVGGVALVAVCVIYKILGRENQS